MRGGVITTKLFRCFALIILFSVLSTFFVFIPVRPARADSDSFTSDASYEWIEGNKIRCSQEGNQVYSPTSSGKDKNILAIKEDEYGSDFNDYNFYKGDKPTANATGGFGGRLGESHTETYYIAVKKDLSKSYQYIVDNYSSQATVYGRGITINDPNKKAPAKALKITKGRIAGKVYQINPSAWGDTKFGPNVTQGEVTLRSDAGGEVSFSGHGAGSVTSGAQSKINPSNLEWYPFVLSSKDYLWTGRYRIVYEFKKDAECDTGNANDGLSLSKVCAVTMKGIVNFDLTALSDGSAKITMVGNDDPGENNCPADGKTTNQISGSEGINLGISYNLSSPLDGILEQAMKAVLDFISGAIKLIGGWINSILNFGNDINNSAMIAVWTRVRNISLSLLTLGILIIAFANILNIDLEKYGINRMIPRLVMAVVMTYFSFVILRFLLEVAAALQALALGGTSLNVAELGNGKFSAAFNGDVADYAGGVGMLILLCFIGFIIVVAMLWLLLVLIVRIAVIWFLVALAPIAFLMMIMPFTESLYQQWWAKFWKWAFMGPAIAFMLFMTDTFLTVGFGTAFAGSANMDQPASWIFLLLGAAGIFIAASLPMTMGSDVFSGLKGALGKIRGGAKFGDWLTGKRVSGRLGIRKGMREEQRKVRDMQHYAKMGALRGRVFGGMNAQQQSRAKLAYVQALSKEYTDTNMSKDALEEKVKHGNIFEKKAAALTLIQSGGLLSTDKKDVMSAVHSMIMQPGGAIKDQALFGALYKDQSEALAAMGMHGLDTGPWADKAMYKGLANPKEAKGEHIQYMLAKRRQVFENMMNNKDTVKSIIEAGPGVSALYGQALRETGHTTTDTDLQGMYNTMVKAAITDETEKGKPLFGSPGKTYAAPTIGQGSEPGQGPEYHI